MDVKNVLSHSNGTDFSYTTSGTSLNNASDDGTQQGTGSIQITGGDDFAADGYILAIGGGGEGTIGRLKGSQVIAVDILKSELLEAPDGPLKIIMDARDLKFIDKTFTRIFIFKFLRYSL